MASEAARTATPGSQEELAGELAAAAAAGLPVRIRGAGTKLSWATVAALEPALDLCTAGLDRVVEHNAGDLTAVVEAGVPLAAAQRAFATAGQMLALDPPDGGATVGGVVVSGDSGPLRARFGGARDLVVGMRVALSDGTRAKSGGKVIKNVAGYDLAKLFAGSLGTLGAILELAVRLHPVPPASVTAVGRTGHAGRLAEAAAALAHAPLEHFGLDVRWEDGGSVLARFCGAAPRPQADAAARVMREAGLEVEVAEPDAGLWDAQREVQRARAGEPDTVVRISARQTDLPELLGIASASSAVLVGRAGLGLHWLRLPEPASVPDALTALRRDVTALVLDAPADLRGRVDAWGPRDPAALALMRRVKDGFDPAGACAPGVLP
jgi:glycolate oxidase FAD binding subunit